MVANQKSITADNQPVQPGLFAEIPPHIVRPRKPRKAKSSTVAPYQLRDQAIRKVEATFTGYVTASATLMRCWEGENADVAEAAALRQYDQSAKALRQFVETALGMGVPTVDLMMAIADSLAEGKGK